MKSLIIHGKGRHGHVVASAALALGWKEVVYTDDQDGTTPPDDKWCFVAIGDNKTRKANNRKLLATVIHPRAYVDPSARLAPGVFVGANATVHLSASVGRGAIVNTGAIVEHDCAVGDWSHVSPGAVLCGAVTLGEGVWVGANAVIKQGITVAPWTVIGCGAVVVKDITEPGTYIGVPAKRRANAD